MKKKIGLLFSLSGTISIVGDGQLQAALLAIEELNKKSGVMKFESVIRDAKSDPHVAAREAYSLFKDSKIDALIGCYMSSVRNAIIPVLNETGGLLLYPTVYEGEQVHPNIFYLGAIPNQQIEPMLSWAINNSSSNFVCVGSDYVYPRDTNKQVKQWVENAGGRVCLEDYFPLGCSDFGDFFKKIRNLRKVYPTFVVFSTIVGTSVGFFYKEYKKQNIPFSILSPITSEREIQYIGKEASCGHICTSAYFQTIDSEINIKFVNAFKEHFGEKPISREMAASYDAVHMIASACSRISSITGGKNRAEKFRMALKDFSFQGIQGKVRIDPITQHLWQWSRIGRVNSEGKIETIWRSPGPVPPKIVDSRVGLTIQGNLDLESNCGFRSLVGANEKFVKCIHLAKIAARTSSNVLITGETGTGKELFARAIHATSSRKNHPFIPVNCATLPRDLIGSELFGYEEGAFTGAKKGGKAGKFEVANGGTLFLDEIGDMPNDMQAHLLRAIEEREIYKIGGTEPIRLDVRLIAATNKDLLQEATKGGTFRRDLYYRLNVFHINLPNLCDRIDDIHLLADYFLHHLCCKNATIKEFAPETLKVLESYSWPGNVRELSNLTERSFYLSMDSKVIRCDHLPDYIINPQPEPEKDKIYKYSTPIGNFDSRYLVPTHGFPKSVVPIRKNEEQYLKQILSRCGYNISRTASLLGISRSTLYRKISRYKIKIKRGL
jgi:DNA-binding NtrC family response regulator/ABC-type branched-subunit amino acid transport system substrate-binding protein